MRRLRPSPAQTLAGVSLVAASLAVAFTPTAAEPPQPDFTLVPLGTYSTGVFDQSAAEIVAHDPASQRLFVVNFAEQQVDIVSIADPTAPDLVGSVELGGSPNGVDVFDGLVAVAVEASEKIDPGKVVFLDVDGNKLGEVEVGALPDSLAFTPDGTKVVVANEGEPFSGFEGDLPAYTSLNDPDGTISIIDLASGLASAEVATATFGKFEGQRDELVAAGVRINPDVDTVAQDIEPEYVTISADSATAWVSLQENNAIAEVDLATAEVTQIIPLGRKDHSVPGNGIDPSDRDPEGAPTFNIRTYDNLYGIHMPDAIDNVEIGGVTYLLTANEGDAREYTGLTDVSRVKSLRDVVAERTGLDRPTRADALCGNFGSEEERKALVEDNELGRLKVSTIDGYDEDNNCFSELHALGARSFSVFTTDGALVFDSGEDFERITHARYPENFNSNHRRNDLESRSDDKGPEPEPITVFELWERTYAMIGFERMGGVITYDISDPYAPVYVDYTNNRNFNVQPFDDLAGAGDLGIEDIVFIPSAQSPNMRPLVVTANEVSGTTTVFEIVRGRPVPPVCASTGPGSSNRSGKVPPPCDRPFPPGRGR